ncbi:hypothetical protein [Streptomyces bohaiensis]|uniref:Uncharacterized protein n=1 Tax=Streptomyces bohaiensis TaxID=1431344 RepID=A0ABX1CI95_9ACTN|nr:hypothetical protein [Streptomyces bohaiensis]NJQ17172.1 hypothetical protein [Streptomyces bohaiensis]
MRRISAAIVGGISATLLAASVPSASAAETDIPSDYSQEDLRADLVIEDVEGEELTPEEELELKAPDPDAFTVLSATGSTPIGSFNFSWNGLSFKIPAGCFLTHSIKGSKKKITSQIAGVDCVGPTALAAQFCNSRLEFHYADTNGKTYRIKRGPLNSSCRTGTIPSYKLGAQTLPHYGKACTHLYVASKRRAVQCHNITS